MAKRLRDVCRLPENENLWRAGRGFVVRDRPWTIQKLKAIPLGARGQSNLQIDNAIEQAKHNLPN